MKKQLSLLLAILLVCGLLAACGQSKPEAGTPSGDAPSTPGDAAGETPPTASGNGEIVIKLAHAAKPGSARDLGAQKIKEVVEAETDGRVEVQIYPASQLGGGPDLIQGMQTGTVEMVILPSSFMGGFQPLTTIMDIPYLLPDNYEDLARIEQGPAGEALRATTDAIGVATLDIWHTGYKTFTAQTALEEPGDFKGLKFRVMPSPIQIAQYEVLGATAVNMDFSECYNALQTGAIDGQENPLDTTTDMNFQEVQKHCTLSRHGVLDQFIMAGKTWFDGLDADIQEAIMKGVEAGRTVALEKMLEAETAALEKMEAAGIEIIELTDAQIAVWREALAPVRDTYVEQYGDEAQVLLDLFEAEVAALG